MESFSRFNIQHVNQDIHLLPLESHRQSMIWLHGLGDTSKGFVDVFMDKTYNIVPQTCKVILPTAPERPVTGNQGAVMTSWYDILSFEKPSYGRLTLSDHFKRYDQDQIKESVAQISKMIDEEAKLLGSSKKVFIGGFSQGCAISIATLLSYPEPLGGVVCLSGAQSLKITDWTNYNQQFKKDTPLFLYHGRDDPVIPYAVAAQSYMHMNTHGGFETKIQMEAMVHQVTEKELKKVAQFLAQLMV